MKWYSLAAALSLSLLLSGCGWMNDNYVSITPHQEQKQTVQTAAVTARDYLELMHALETMITAGTETAVIHVAEYPPDAVESGIAVAVRYAMESVPIGAYAVEDIRCELGTSGGQPAIAVEIQYRHSRAEIRQIRKLKDMEALDAVVARNLEDHSAGVVVLVEAYSPRDFTQLVQNYARENPQAVMETPQVTAGIYGEGQSRVVELRFVYQTARDSLRQMKTQVKPVFDAAVLYVSGDGADWQKFSQLYGFLMERFEYDIETSITPAYSLLRHGVGDSRAFATVYSAMCRAAGMECMVVTGTRAGEPWTWNIIRDNGNYYHVDLLRSKEKGRFLEMTDEQMQGYVWDYSAYPACVVAMPKEEPVQIPQTMPTESTEPGETVPQTEGLPLLPEPEYPAEKYF